MNVYRLAVMIGIVSLWVSCSREREERYIWFSSESGEMRRSAISSSRSPALRVVIASVLSPRASYSLYDDLLTYISERIGRPVERLQRPTYAEANDLIRHGDAEVGFVCSLAYVQGHRDFGLELLAAPVVYGKQTYQSYLLVPSDSGVDEVEDLRGKVFAFTDPLSNSGRLAPTYLLHQRGERPETFFGRVIYTYSHDRSIYAVANKLVDGAAVDSLVFEHLAKQDASLRSRLRVVWKSPSYGIPPFVANPRLNADLKERLRQVLFGMHEDDKGQRILRSLGIERFASVEDSAYDSIRAMLGELERQP